MKQFRERKKREYTSIYDDFREDIERWCDEGLTIKEAYERMPDGYTYQGFYSYLRTHHILEKAWRKALETRKVCDKCEYCKEILTDRGQKSEKGNRVCALSWRIISHYVSFCPRWCEYREKHEGKEVETK